VKYLILVRIYLCIGYFWTIRDMMKDENYFGKTPKEMDEMPFFKMVIKPFIDMLLWPYFMYEYYKKSGGR